MCFDAERICDGTFTQTLWPTALEVNLFSSSKTNVRSSIYSLE